MKKEYLFDFEEKNVKTSIVQNDKLIEHSRNKNLLLELRTIIEANSGEKYQIVRFLGAGKNNMAYYVMCLSGVNRGQFFSLKIQYNLDKKRVKRFFREITFLKQQKYDFILKYYDYGDYHTLDSEIYPFVVLSYLPYTLKDYFDFPEFTFEKKIRFSCQLLSTLVSLKRQNVLHRDIKPQNILTDGEVAVLGDFGLVKNLNKEILLGYNMLEDERDLLNASVTMPKVYRTPELVEYANHRDILRIESDVFQLGLVFSEIFTSFNPVLNCESKLENIQLDILPKINVEKYGDTIHNLISGMLVLDYKKRLTVEELLDRYIDLYQAVIST